MDAESGVGTADVPPRPTGPHGWAERHDPGLRALKRSVRAAMFVPAVFAVAKFGTSNPQTPLFAVFGSVSLLLFTDFGGPRPVRARSYGWLWLTGVAFISLGTACSRHAVLAVAAMAVVAFLVLSAGVITPQAVAGSTAALLLLILPLAVPAPWSSVGDRLLGWVLAGAFCIPATLFLWPGRWHDRLRARLADAARSVADLVDATDPDVARVERCLADLRGQYEATPYRPTGAGPTDVALSNLVSRLEWVGARAIDAARVRSEAAGSVGVAGVTSAAAAVLRTVAGLLDPADVGSHREAVVQLRKDAGALVAARGRLTEATVGAFLVEAGPGGTDPEAVAPGPGRVSRTLEEVDPTYPVRMVAFATGMLADGALEALPSPAHGRGRLRRIGVVVHSYLRVGAGHLTPRSVWFRNSVRGAVALALAVAVVEATSVQHGFWVVLGTLSVLRSNALGTGSTAVRAVVGTALGFGLGSLVLVVIGHHDVLLWVVLPLAVLVAGFAPTAISFTAGQAGFTVFVVVVFNIIHPVGSAVGLLRVEDVLIGVSVSVVVGLLFWPRGASAQLARATGEAYAAATAWLVSSIDRVGAVEPDGDGDGGTGSAERSAAVASAHRLDDAYRQFLSERGEKAVPMPVVTRLLTGCAQIRLTAVTLESLPVLRPAGVVAPLPEVVAVRTRVAGACATVESWFDEFARSLGRRSASTPPVPPSDDHLVDELVGTWGLVRREGRRDGVFAVLRLLWVEQRIDDLRGLQADLAGSAAQIPG